MMRYRRTALLLSALAILLAQEPLRAQSGLSVGAGAGAAIPAGQAGERRDLGPAAMLSVEARMNPRWSVRLDGEWSLLGGPTAPAGQEHVSSSQDLRTVGASLNLVMRLSEAAFSPYLLAGAGAYRLQRVNAPKSPYGTTAALQAGVGAEAKMSRRIGAFVEARAQMHATDYGADEYGATVFWPVLAGIRIR
jgi:hypothetical protein